MFVFRWLLAVFLAASTSAAHAEPRVSIGYCGDADVQLAFKDATARHPLIEELRVAMKAKSATKFAYNSIEGADSTISLYLRDRRTNVSHRVLTSDYNTLRCIEMRGEPYLFISTNCGGSGCGEYDSQLFRINRWHYLTQKGESSVKQVKCEWECLVRALGPAFEIEDDGITTLLETGDPATFDAPPRKKRRLPAHTLPTGKECETIGRVYEQCVDAQRESCSKTFDIAMNLSNATRGNYYSISGLNTKFDVTAFETACQAVCRKSGKALTEKAITATFCG